MAGWFVGGTILLWMQMVQGSNNVQAHQSLEPRHLYAVRVAVSGAKKERYVRYSQLGGGSASKFKFVIFLYAAVPRRWYASGNLESVDLLFLVYTSY